MLCYNRFTYIFFCVIISFIERERLVCMPMDERYTLLMR